MSFAAPITILRRMKQNEHLANADPVRNVWSSNNPVASFTTASMWIRNCLQNHGTCNQTSSTGRHLPTHLVDLGTDVCVPPRLCYSKDLPVETSYMTLSHCRGGLVFLRLLREDIESLQEWMPANELSNESHLMDFHCHHHQKLPRCA